MSMHQTHAELYELHKAAARKVFDFDHLSDAELEQHLPTKILGWGMIDGQYQLRAFRENGTEVRCINSTKRACLHDYLTILGFEVRDGNSDTQ
jgi:hypothetical protein